MDNTSSQRHYLNNLIIITLSAWDMWSNMSVEEGQNTSQAPLSGLPWINLPEKKNVFEKVTTLKGH